MSHFSVLVITPQEPTDESLKAALQPFHEYECTGVEDQYVVDVDKTDELEAEWAGLVPVVRFPDGSIKSKYDSSFYTKDGELDFSGKPRKEFELPVGCELAEVPQSDLSASEGQSREEYAEDDHGWTFRDGKFWRRTNPNKKWDWWTIGGRYGGKFAPNYNPQKDPANIERCIICGGSGTRCDNIIVGKCNGCDGTGKSVKFPSKWRPVGNQIRVGDIPWDALRQSQIADALSDYDKAVEATKGLELPKDWDALREELGIDAARNEWHSNKAVKALRKLGIWEAEETIKDLRLSRDEISARAARRPVTCWAVLKDGIWSEKGSMGWFGMSSGDKDPEQWTEEVTKLLESLPPDSWITVVDCHI